MAAAADTEQNGRSVRQAITISCRNDEDEDEDETIVRFDDAMSNRTSNRVERKEGINERMNEDPPLPPLPFRRLTFSYYFFMDGWTDARTDGRTDGWNKILSSQSRVTVDQYVPALLCSALLCSVYYYHYLNKSLLLLLLGRWAYGPMTTAIAAGDEEEEEEGKEKRWCH